MTGFVGFPSGKNNPYIPIPEVFFTQVLPEIEDMVELKVTLHLFWILAQKRGNPRCISDRELQHDQVLLHSLRRRGDPRPPEERLQQGLELAVARGTLLRAHLRLISEGSDQAAVIYWYFFNTARSRKVVEELQGGEIVPVRMLDQEQRVHTEREETALSVEEYATSRGLVSPSNQALTDVEVHVERPNIFSLYEQNIGLLSPMVADELKDAATHYPPGWIEQAFRVAVEQNKRKWSYIRAILRRWETEGRH
ncbi:DnaD/phage-associated family protein [Thermosporothrix hazakensis]|jgi:DnaD/phage-associated family protein|uniref:DnaD/phage-associated family protein n=2 Tax=Thermosporothrix TaxID=768650 RepID=A0A326TVJ0_THEHA|nr:DnaD domain protein [Thermosporothrix hazakensis]PZW20805.1 DnaD/phage-associated family protein [Thermosporothrix hazakensis]